MTTIPARAGAPRRLEDLLSGIATGSRRSAGGHPVTPGVAVTGISCDSRSVQPGDLFVAVRGTSVDGNSYVADALAKGASAVIADRPDLVSNGDAGRPVILVRDSRRILALLAANFYDHPAEDMTVVGITGTLGKTSVALMLWHLWRQAGLSAGLIGSLGIRYKDQVLPSSLTTPDALTLQGTLSDMRNNGITHVVMEVSSHALMQHRVRAIPFQAAVFTNLLPHEHSDYHPTFSDYLRTKKMLLDFVVPGGKVIYNSDSQAVESILGEFSSEKVRFKIEHPFCQPHNTSSTPQAYEHQLIADEISVSAKGSFFNLKMPVLQSAWPVQIALLGIGSVINAVEASACALALGLSPETVVRGLKSLPPIQRRMEVIYQDQFTVIDDTCGHPESFNRLFDTVEAVHPAGIVMVIAIRGHRGVHINKENGKCVAEWAKKIPISDLIITEGMDVTDDLNLVDPLERDAFLGELNRKAGLSYRYYLSLEDAIDAALASVGKNELLILAGSQGMDKGRDILGNILEYGKYHTLVCTPGESRYIPGRPFSRSQPRPVSVPLIN